jgi:molybdopterin adenylyltransferase
MPQMNSAHDPLRIGLVSVSDRASSGVYEDKGIPALKQWPTAVLQINLSFGAPRP